MEEYSVATISIIVFFHSNTCMRVNTIKKLKLKGKSKKVENFVNHHHPDVTMPPTKN